MLAGARNNNNNKIVGLRSITLVRRRGRATRRWGKRSLDVAKWRTTSRSARRLWGIPSHESTSTLLWLVSSPRHYSKQLNYGLVHVQLHDVAPHVTGEVLAGRRFWWQQTYHVSRSAGAQPRLKSGGGQGLGRPLPLCGSDGITPVKSDHQMWTLRDQRGSNQVYIALAILFVLILVHFCLQLSRESLYGSQGRR